MENNINPSLISQAYQQLAEDYTNILECLSDAQINQMPRTGGWSAGQVIGHITKANQSSFLSVEGVRAERNVGEQIPDLEKTFLNFSIKMMAPDFLIPADKVYTKLGSITDIKQCFDSLIKAKQE